MALGTDQLPDERDRAIAPRPDSTVATLPEDTEGDLQVEELEDGGANVTELETKDTEEGDFDENLAEVLDETEIDAVARDLLRRIEQDKDARMKRDQQYEEGLKRTGLGEDAPGGAQFTGASKVTHPMLTEACVDFHASAMKELFPPSGPVRTEIIGEQTPEQLRISDRQFRYMNWQLQEQIEEYADELAVTMTQLPMGGSQYMKFWPDETEKRPCTEFVPIDDLLVPYGCNSFWTAHRITHVQRLTESTFDDRVESEMYRDVSEVHASSETPTQTRAGRASEKIEGVDQPMENLDGIRLVYETNCFLKLKSDGEKRLPYLISIDERTGKVLSIYRNWEEDDKKKKRLHWIADYNFIPWRGAYKMGIAQMLGGLSAAATGALRALLDSALVQTIPVLAKLKGAKFGSQSKVLDPMTITEVEAGTTVDDIRKVLMAMPFNPPSPVLYALLGWLSDAAKGVVTTAEEKIADASNSMPVGTALALIESGAKVFSSIHAGLHRSQKKALQIIARINRTMGVDEAAQIEKFGKLICSTEDFRKPLGVIPVSDPNIFSEGQRYAQMQLVTSFALGADPKTGMPTTTAKMHNQYEVLHRTYELAKIPNIDEILPPPKQPTELNSAAENSAVMLGNPVMAFPEQNHFAHLESHMRFVIDPLFGGNPAAVPMAWPQMIEHIKQHLSFLYAQQMHEIASAALGVDISQLLKDKQNWNKVDEVLAAASRVVHDKLSKVLEPLGPQINQMIQKIESMKPPAPMDPSQASIMIARMEDSRAKMKDQTDASNKAADRHDKQQLAQRTAGQKDTDLALQNKKIDLDHGLATEELDLKKTGQEHDQTLEVANHAMAQQDSARNAELEQANQEHQHGLDQHGAVLAGQDQQHRHQLEQRGAQRDDQTADHTREMDVTDRRLQEADQAHGHRLGEEDLALRAAGEGHKQGMDLGGHHKGVQQDEHQRRMDEADLSQRKTEHKAGLRQSDQQRKDEQSRHADEMKARDADRKLKASQPKPDKKPPKKK